MYERLINQASAADDAVYHMEEAQVALRECGLGEYASILDEFIAAARKTERRAWDHVEREIVANQNALRRDYERSVL